MELPGAYTTGAQRAGKSYGGRYLAKRMSDFLGRPVVGSRLVIQKNLPDRESSLVAEWCCQEEVSLNSNTPSRLRMGLKHHFWSKADEINARDILIIIDEAQNMTRIHLGQVMAFSEVLIGPGEPKYRPFLLLTGQPELSAFFASFEAMNEMQLIGRYFERKHEFLGIDPLDIPTVLKAYEMDVMNADGTTSSPPVALLFPDAWAEGWRLARWLQPITQGFADIASRCSLPRDQRVPFQHLHSTLLSCVLYVQALGDPFAEMTPEVVHAAIADTGLHGTWARYASLAKK
jgi:hypothetical protein